MAIPYCNEAWGHVSCGIYALFIRGSESEITNIVPQVPSSIPSFAVSSDGKQGGSLGTRLLIQYSMCNLTKFSWGAYLQIPLHRYYTRYVNFGHSLLWPWGMQPTKGFAVLVVVWGCFWNTFCANMLQHLHCRKNVYIQHAHEILPQALSSLSMIVKAVHGMSNLGG